MTIYKELRDYCSLDREAAVEVMTNMRDDDDSFEVENYLFVRTNHLDEYLADYLKNDEYHLGSFTSWFIAGQTNIDADVIEAMQAAEAYEAVGKLILSICDMEEFAEAAASGDGYGHFLNRYDGSEIEIGEYHAFLQS